MRAALRLVWALDVRHLVAHRTRLALSALGIAAGVALAVSVGSLGSSITGSLEGVARAAASDADLEIRANGNAGIPPDVLGRVRDVEGVSAAGATIETYLNIRAAGAETAVRVLVMGVDGGILAMSPQAVDPSTMRASDPFGLMLPAELASELDVDVGDGVEIVTPRGWRRIGVGTVLAAGAGRPRVAVSTVGVMQDLLGKDGYDAIYVDAPDPEAALPRVQEAVGPVARVGPIALRNEQLSQLLASANASFSIGTIVALFVGAFLVYNTMAMAAVERLQEAALLRAVGARRRQVFALFCAEGGLLGLIGSAAGVGLGLVLSSRLLSQRGGALEEIFPIQVTHLTVSPRVLVTAGVAGVLAALAAALLPARRVARADPAPSLGPTGAFEDPTIRQRRLSTIVGVACAIAGPVVSVRSIGSGTQATGVTLAGFAVTLTGVALLIPTAIPAIARVALGALSRMRRGSGVVRLASGELLRSPARTSFTVGAVLLSLALVVGFSVGQTSFTRAFDQEFEDIISADLYVRSNTWRPFGSDVLMDHRIADEIERFEGVEASWPFRFMPATYEDRAVAVLAYDLEKYAQHTRAETGAARRFARQARAVGDRDAVLASSSFLAQFGFEIGDTVTLPTPTGPHTLEIAGAFPDPAAITPEIVFDHRKFIEVWGTGGADSFAVIVAEGASIDPVLLDLRDSLGPRYGVEIDTREEYFDLLSGAIDSVAQLISSVQLVAVMVAGLGLANTLLISTFERRRDIGVLRAVGMLRRQVRRMVAVEALLIGGLGVVLAWGLGTAIGLGMTSLIEAQLGVPLRRAFPPMAYVGAALLGLVAALGASIYPARRAAGLDVVAALQYE